LEHNIIWPLKNNLIYSHVYNEIDVISFSLDPEEKDMLIEVIEKLLADKTTVSKKFYIKPVFFFTF
jgi:hypothetical protein